MLCVSYKCVLYFKSTVFNRLYICKVIILCHIRYTVTNDGHSLILEKNYLKFHALNDLDGHACPFENNGKPKHSRKSLRKKSIEFFEVSSKNNEKVAKVCCY